MRSKGEREGWREGDIHIQLCFFQFDDYSSTISFRS